MTTQPTRAKDPVCGMTVDPAKAKATAEHAGQNYYFCCAGCAQKFQSNPEQYLKPKPALVTIGAPLTAKAKPLATQTPVSSATDASVAAFVCPMCPEVRESKSGACPICGMALEPRTVTATEEENPELRNMTRRFWSSVALTAPLLVIAMVNMLPGMPIPRVIPAAWLPWIELALASPVVLWAGWPFFQRGWASVVNRSTNMFTLI